jgi:hypothetical protein
LLKRIYIEKKGILERRIFPKKTSDPFVIPIQKKHKTEIEILE